MATIHIQKGEELKISIKDPISQDDIFIEEYRRAASMLNDIISASKQMKKNTKTWSWKQQDFENNIIAFCGERGEGKSSAMMTFVNAVYKDIKKEHPIFSSCDHLKDVYFSEPILIDPSLFDDVHNVLDIVLAKIFQNFYNRYCQDNQCIDERRRESLLDQFQKVYRSISLIINQKQMLDDEFDYEGNISKLTKLGASTNLKRELSELIDQYLEFMDNKKEDQQLIIAIDDLDLCSQNAYKMTEQIRKYLIIPNVSIIISVKIEQLELCIQEKNLKDFQEIYKNKEEQTYQNLNHEIQTMAKRYVEKLIPIQRRIFLPNVQDLYDIRIIYKEQDQTIWDSGPYLKNSTNKETSFIDNMLILILEKTGMYFLPDSNEHSYLLPNNLRNMINWIGMLVNMKQPEGDSGILLENIRTFKKYFYKEWSEHKFIMYNGLSLQEIGAMDTFHLHIAVHKILKEIYTNINPDYNEQLHTFTTDRMDCFFQVMGLFENLSKCALDIHTETSVYQLRILYTIKLNELLHTTNHSLIDYFIGGYIWGPWFSNLLPAHWESQIDRSRFAVGTIACYNLILKTINENCPPLPSPQYGKLYHISYIADNEYRNEYIMAWVLLGMFSNVFYINNNRYVLSSNASIIFDNSVLYEMIHISLENYLVSLCNLDALYQKVNMKKLGIEWEEFATIIDALNYNNWEITQYAKAIISNMDLAMNLKDYAMKNREYKGNTKDETDRSKKLTERFFRNITALPYPFDSVNKKRIKNHNNCYWESLDSFTLDENNTTISIINLYANLFDLGVQDMKLRSQLEENSKIEEIVSVFRKKLIEIPENWNHEVIHVSKSLRNLTADNVKYNLDKLADSVQAFLGEHQQQPNTLDVDGLCRLYSQIIKLYLKDKTTTISPELYNEYKWLVKVHNEIYPNKEEP